MLAMWLVGVAMANPVSDVKIAAPALGVTGELYGQSVALDRVKVTEQDGQWTLVIAEALPQAGEGGWNQLAFVLPARPQSAAVQQGVARDGAGAFLQLDNPAKADPRHRGDSAERWTDATCTWTVEWTDFSAARAKSHGDEWQRTGVASGQIVAQCASAGEIPNGFVAGEFIGVPVTRQP